MKTKKHPKTKKPIKTIKKAKKRPAAQRELETTIARLEKEIEEIKARNALLELEQQTSQIQWSEHDTKACWDVLEEEAVNEPVWAINKKTEKRRKALLLYYYGHGTGRKVLLLLCPTRDDRSFILVPGYETPEYIYEYAEADCLVVGYDATQAT